MRLFELAYGCRLYGQLDDYDRSLRRFRTKVAPVLDPYDTAHRAALFTWLNAWTCRQFTKEHHATIASDSLIRWANAWLGSLPAHHVELTELSKSEIVACAAAYDALRTRQAGLRRLARGRASSVTYGPTGAAKALFALRPNVFPPWDDPIRGYFRYGPDAASFGAYLTTVAGLLREISAEAGVPVSALPSLVGRPDSSPPKLIDEYNWVTVTKRRPIPPAEALEDWARLAGLARRP
ncbi:MAG: hypothetical protein WEG56_07405 [Chloroflexota bacterium]